VLTDWAIFCPLGRLSTLGSVLKNIEVAQIFVLLFPLCKFGLDFNQKWVGLHFWRFLHKLK
jgi:hypothetical protein